MVMTVMSVATPIVSPSAVSEARSLCSRRALKHCARLSLTASMAAEWTSQLILSTLQQLCRVAVRKPHHYSQGNAKPARGLRPQQQAMALKFGGCCRLFDAQDLQDVQSGNAACAGPNTRRRNQSNQQNRQTQSN